LPEEIRGTIIPTVIYPASAMSARYQLDTIPANSTTAAETITAMQIGEMVWA